jgi:hypothetical protein
MICPDGDRPGSLAEAFSVNERGQKTAAVIDLRKHEQVWEDFYGSLLTQTRAKEPRETLAAVRQRLKAKPKKRRHHFR